MNAWLWTEVVLPCALLVSAVWITFYDILQGTWVSDDLIGIASYDGKMQKPLEWGNLFKWFRWQFGKVTNPSKAPGQPAYVQSAVLHHRLNLWVACGVAIACYTFLARLLPVQVAFLTTLLFIVHPLGVQTIGWISGVGYTLSLFWTLLGLNLLFLMQDWGWTHGVLLFPALGLYALFHFLAMQAQFSAAGVSLILLFLGQWPFALTAALVSGHGLLTIFREAILLRVKVYKEQNMAAPTRFGWRKLIVVGKTLYYYTRLVCFPKRLGLYHTFGYHYQLPEIEQEDKYLWAGAAIAILLAVGLSIGPFPLRLAIIWYLAFALIFLNWITAHQFVSERYMWMPALGACLIVAAYAPAWLCWLIIGLALMRTWSHLPTYYNEQQFYLSNLHNFPSSEIAAGNLGVVYINAGLIGTAIETFVRGIALNAEYDVCWYNISSLLRSRGAFAPNYLPLLFNLVPAPLMQDAMKYPNIAHLKIARHFLVKAIQAKTCHFAQAWSHELKQLDSAIARASNGVAPVPGHSSQGPALSVVTVTAGGLTQAVPLPQSV